MGVATYVWRRLDLEGSVFVRLDDGAGGVAADGYEICAEAGARWAAHFRVAPDVGAEIEVLAAYVETPALSVRPLVQRYRRTAADRWVYADDLYGTFEYGSDTAGVAVDYEGLAERR